MTNKKSTNQYNNNNYNKKEIDLHEPLIKNIDKKKYNTINATERKNINALNEPLTQIHNNNKIKYRSIIKPNRISNISARSRTGGSHKGNGGHRDAEDRYQHSQRRYLLQRRRDHQKGKSRTCWRHPDGLRRRTVGKL